MLSVNSYPRAYVDACRQKFDSQVSTFERLAKEARSQGGATHSALDDFEPIFYNNLVLALDTYFCHRSRTMEGKDGNPLNEVRVLCSSMMNNDNRMAIDKAIKLDPKKSLLHHDVGDEIKLDESAFRRLADGFFAEIERKFVSN